MSAFGGIIAVNRKVDAATAGAMADQFLEVVIAPDYDPEALEVLGGKPNTRVLQDEERRVPLVGDPAVRQVLGGLLVQDRDLRPEDRSEMQVVSARQPTEAEYSAADAPSAAAMGTVSLANSSGFTGNTEKSG